MPFKSEKQRKYLWANEPEIARDWTDTYGSKIHKADGGRIGLRRGSGPGPGGQGARGQATQNPGTGGRNAPPGGGSGGQGGAMHYQAPTYQTVHDTGAVSQTPGPKPTPDRDGIVGYLKNLSQKANRRGLKKNLDHYLGGKKLDFPMFLAALKGPREEDDYYTEFAGLSPIEMQQRYEGTLSQEDMDRVQHMSSVLGQPNITREDYESAFWGPKGPPQSDTGGGEGQPYIWPPYGMASAPEEEVVEDEVVDLGEGNYRVPEQYRVAEGGRIPAAFGGIMDTYTGRRKYGFGSFLKKITKPIKKFVKSPLGKAALLGGIGYLATPGSGVGLSKWLKPAGKGAWWKKAIMGTPWQKGPQSGVAGGLKGMLSNPWVSIPAASAAAGLYTAMKPPEELESATGEWDEDKEWWDNYLASLGQDNYRVPTEYRRAEGGRIGRQEGGLMNLGGMEKDYRNDGGFVPLGGEEKADDVPARLSKNEFVFTADAVRNAGGGDIDRGAEVMENVMKNLEGGGQISEESQGQGAQEMFETSERLSEVI